MDKKRLDYYKKKLVTRREDLVRGIARSSGSTVGNFWRDVVSGTSYQVQVEVPQPQMTSASDVALVPLTPQAQGQGRAKGPRMPVQADTPSNPEASPLIFPPPRAMRFTCG